MRSDNPRYKFHGQPIVEICKLCNLALPHQTPRAKQFHKEKERANQEALKRWRKRQEAKLISGEYWRGL